MTTPERAQQTDPFIGKLALGRYRVVRWLAKGGMGTIYLARSEGAEGFVKPVVVKRVLPHLVGDESMVRMFVREAKILASLHHPGIVDVYDFDREGDDYLMAMEYVNGYNLAHWRRYVQQARGLFPVEPAVHVAIQVLDALHYAHTLTDSRGKSLGIVHRDVTPSNVLVDTNGNVKLFDFGIARTERDATEPDVDGPKVKGKFPYIAPEVLGGEQPGPSTDVYATAVMLHEVLAGQNEFAAADPRTTILNVIRLVPRRLDALRDDVTRQVADVIARGLAKDPKERYATAAEFAAALRAARSLSGDEARAELAQLAASDFADPAMSGMSGTDDLGTLERAWRQSLRPPPPIESVGGGDGASGTSPVGTPRRNWSPDGETRVEPTRRPSFRPRGGSSRWIVALSAAAVVCAAAAVVFALLYRRDDGPPAQLVYIQGSAVPTEDAGGAASRPTTNNNTSAADASVATPTATQDAGSANARVIRPNDPTVALSRTFARQQGRISQCYEQNAGDVTGNPELSVRLELGQDGQVTDATIAPATLATTNFGRCVIGVARSVHFGPQPNRIAFRIPIAVRRVQRR